MTQINPEVTIIILSFILVGSVTGCDLNSLYEYSPVEMSNTDWNLISFADMKDQVTEPDSKAYIYYIMASPELPETTSTVRNTPISTSSETVLKEPVIGDKVIYDKSVPDSEFSIFYRPVQLIFGAIGIIIIFVLLILYSRLLRSRNKGT
ncbi:hypothetical protein [Methanogenium sp. MK-MG]|uniref:hypothetical protein n=1 Tax=Methanogenium sp. MK-MG TaxID=2599926 RepID=UPI0013E9AB00|nr:hypothetical protein [Methanogenium sp. MK-MG]KAF1074383.1 hypothetical protein MKMG_01951 [Methanogenium sp. MK-MG]